MFERIKRFLGRSDHEFSQRPENDREMMMQEAAFTGWLMPVDSFVPVDGGVYFISPSGRVYSKVFENTEMASIKRVMMEVNPPNPYPVARSPDEKVIRTRWRSFIYRSGYVTVVISKRNVRVEFLLTPTPPQYAVMRQCEQYAEANNRIPGNHKMMLQIWERAAYDPGDQRVRDFKSVDGLLEYVDMRDRYAMLNEEALAEHAKAVRVATARARKMPIRPENSFGGVRFK